MAYADKTIRFVIAAAPTMPSWYPATAGTIINLSAALGQSTSSFTLLDSLGVNGTTYPAGTYDSRRLDPYSGGALIYESGRPFLHVYGGGHDDGSWNGTTKYGPLWGSGADTPTWSVGASPSPSGSIVFGSSNGRYADNNPSAQHTYNLPVGVGSRMWMPMPGISYSNGSTNASGPSTPHYWDSVDDTWTYPAYSAAPTPPNGGGGGGAAHFNGNIYVYKPPGDPQRLRRLNLTTGVWTMDTVDTTLAGDSSPVAVDTSRGALLVSATSSTYDSGAYWPNLANFQGTRRTGIAAPPSYASRSLVYDQDRDVFVVPSTTTAAVYELSASALASGGSPSWTTRSFTGPTPANWGPQYTCGRFQYVAELRGYVCVPGATSAVYFYRAT